MTQQLLQLPRPLIVDQNGTPRAGAILRVYEVGTSTPLTVYQDAALTIPHPADITANSDGTFPPIYPDPTTGDLKVDVLQSDGVTHVAGYPVDNIPVTFDGTAVALSLDSLKRTAAEESAGVTPVNYAYAPGDLRRYASFVTGGGDVTTALANCVAQALQTGGAAVYVPAAMGALTVTAGVSVTAPIRIYGDVDALSTISTLNDITIFSFTLAASRSIVERIQLVGKGAGATLPGMLFTNSNNNHLFKVRVRSFGKGIRFAAGINSCYLNTLEKCIIENNLTENIYGEANTNALHLISTQIGGSAQKGLYLVDSNTLAIYGGDCEGVSVCAIDLDATSELRANHVISGMHFEENTSSAGDIRIGNTAVVDGVVILGGLFKPGTGNIAGINAVNCNGLTALGYTQIGAYTNKPFLQKTNLTNEMLIPAGPTADNMTGYQANTFKPNYADSSTLTWNAPTAFDANYQDSANYNLYKINSGSVTAAKDFFARLDVARVENSGGALGAGSKVYAHGAIASNAAGGSTKVGAAFLQGDVDISNGRLAPPKDDGTVQTGAIYQGSGVPSNSNGSNGDIYFRTDTPGTVNQRIYVKSAGSWTGIL